MKLNCGMVRPEIARELAKSAYQFQAEMFPENTSSNVKVLENAEADTPTASVKMEIYAEWIWKEEEKPRLEDQTTFKDKMKVF